MSYVIAIDVGIKNLGLCVYDLASNQVVYWDNVSIVPNGRYIPANNVQYVRDFVAHHYEYFSNAYAVLVERQMRCNMRIIESVLQTMHFHNCHIINARSVKVHYGLSMRNYRANKQKAIEWATQFVLSNPTVFKSNIAECMKTSGKLDDLSDALLLLMYYLDTYSNQNTV